MTAVSVVIDAAGVADRDAELLDTLVAGWEEDVRDGVRAAGRDGGGDGDGCPCRGLRAAVGPRG